MNEDESTEATPTADPVEAPKAETVPRARFSEVIAERNAARTELETLRARVAELEPYQNQAANLAGQLENARVLARNGIIDDDGQAVAVMLFDRLENKPDEGLAGWLASVKTDPENAPRPLRPYLTPATPSAAMAPKPTPSTAAPLADPNATAVAPASGRLSNEALADARRRLANGDRSALADIKRHFETRRN